jgi:hypothetical protein
VGADLGAADLRADSHVSIRIPPPYYLFYKTVQVPTKLRSTTNIPDGCIIEGLWRISEEALLVETSLKPE